MITTECKSVEMHNQTLTQDNVGFNLKGEPVKDIKRGFVCRNAKQETPHEHESFLVHVIVMQHLGQIQNGYTPVLDYKISQIQCKLREITSKIDRRTNKELEQNSKSIKTGDSAIVLMVPTKPMVVEKFQGCPPLGRFVVRDMRATVAVGVIKDATKKSCDAKVTKAAEKKKKK
ncbi:MAG: putative Elongation factor 1-alpha 1 [Streblomastix strix]|uniref:Putative Elongation factor 1-alpha 1 n=1 Tax=Streblomastix strix TaxID=222440 RepID=A0A5J4U3M5_9EUKA|nr:MAG: putative Elongation factor 1-alpha 1 [Streblomastix strix]